VGRASRLVRTTAFRRGVLGTSRGWFTLWATFAVVRFVRGRLGKQPELVGRYELKAGDAVEIRDTGVLRKDGRR
jgi:hypothetical protein